MNENKIHAPEVTGPCSTSLRSHVLWSASSLALFKSVNSSPSLS